MNIIVRMPNWIGDLVMATPVLEDLKKAFPSASITAMCKRPICSLLEKDPAIDELFCFSKPISAFERRNERRNIYEKIREGKYDIGILLTNSFSSAWWFWQGDVKRIVGYSNSFRNFFLDDALKRPQKMHQVDVYKGLLKPLGMEKSKTAPRLFVTQKEVEESKKLLYQRGYVEGKKLIGINIGASYGSAKCWPVERFYDLAQKLLKKEDVYLVFFGDVASMDLVKKISASLPKRAMNIAGVTNLRELACLIKDCDLLITNDSGPMHIADAFQTPLIALFGSTDEELTGPYGQARNVIHKHVSCSPCFKRVCPIDFRCMKEISVDEVLEKAKNWLD